MNSNQSQLIGFIPQIFEVILLTSTIPFLMTKAHAYHSQSPTLGMISSMVSASSISEIENILSQTHYAEVVNEIRPSVDLTQFEIALRRQYANLLTTFSRAADPKISFLLNAFSLLIEADNMQMIIHAILSNSDKEAIKPNIIPVGQHGMEHYERMVGTTTIDAALDFITNSTVNSAAREALKLSADPDEQMFYLSSALSHLSYSLLLKSTPLWMKKQVEILNLETIARAAKLEINPLPWMIKNNGYIYKSANTLSSMKSAREIFTYVQGRFIAPHLVQTALQASDNEIISVFEETALAERFYHHKRNFNIYSNRKESILDFFAIKKAEMEDIMRILLGKIKGVSNELIREMLMIPIYRR